MFLCICVCVCVCLKNYVSLCECVCMFVLFMRVFSCAIDCLRLLEHTHTHNQFTHTHTIISHTHTKSID